MKYFVSKDQDPFLNLAREEYLLKNCQESIFMIYQNDKSVIIGKNQNPHSEAGINYLKENNIKLVRRMSGGGAVYQDMGNINYSFILQDKAQDLYNFKKYSQPIVDVLNKFTTSQVYFSGRNDLLIDEKKISGTAQMVSENNLVHHGTILFNTDFSNISKILLPNDDKLKTKGVKSVISRVGNLINYTPSNYSTTKIIDLLVKNLSNNEELILTDKQVADIEKIAEQKRKSIKFIVENKEVFTNQYVEYIPGFGTIEVYSNLDKDNKINKFKIFGEHFFKNNIEEISEKIIGTPYTKEAISKFVDSISNFDQYFHKLKKEKFVELIIQD